MDNYFAKGVTKNSLKGGQVGGKTNNSIYCRCSKIELKVIKSTII